MDYIGAAVITDIRFARSPQKTRALLFLSYKINKETVNKWDSASLYPNFVLGTISQLPQQQ